MITVEMPYGRFAYRVERTRRQLVEQIEALMEWGVKTRGGPQDVEIELLARSLLTLAEEGGRLVLTRPDEFPPERMSAFARALLAKLARAHSCAR